MKLYVARDASGALYLYYEKPVYYPESGYFYSVDEKTLFPFDTMRLDDSIFPSVKAGKEPKEVVLTLVCQCEDDIEKGGENG